uniref:Uncharacterized protein n=1 Tax=Vitis vinifera TaxID=29760 RepID=A5BTE1_VITVI|nr:hypothetical protein VITISV_021346 [Vitis vinifera]
MIGKVKLDLTVTDLIESELLGKIRGESCVCFLLRHSDGSSTVEQLLVETVGKFWREHVTGCGIDSGARRVRNFDAIEYESPAATSVREGNNAQKRTLRWSFPPHFS